MKKLRKLLTLLLLLCATVTTAHDFEVDGIYYNITDVKKQIVEVTYKGSSVNEYVDEYYDDVILFPNVLYDGVSYSVTSIGVSAFKNCTGLTSVEIPNGVISIKNYAFEGCTGLTDIEIPNSITSISNYVFYRCTSLKDLRIEDGETMLSLGYHTYQTGSTIISSGKGLFYDCPLENLYLGRNLSYNTSSNYGSSPFHKTTLKSVTIGNSVTSIGEYMFSGCAGLESVVISNSVTSIGSFAFGGCTALTDIEIPASIISVGSSAFNDCSGLTIVRTSDLVAWCNIDFESSTANPLYYSRKLHLNGELVEELVIPDDVITIKSLVFKSCESIERVIIPNSVKRIADNAFDGCYNLKTVINFTDLKLKKGSTDNGDVAVYADQVYNVPNGFIENDFILGLSEGRNSLLYYLGNATVLTLPADCHGEDYVVAPELFKNNKTLTSVTIPNSVIGIEQSAFYNCVALESIEIPNSVRNIGDYVFYGCSGLTNVVIGDNVKSIGMYAFRGCSNLTEIIIPHRVASVGSYAFSDCYNISSIKSFVQSENIFEISKSVFANIDKTLCKLYVPYNAINTYKSTSGWSDFNNIEGIKYNVTYKVDGKEYTTVAVNYGEAITLIDEPTKEGHTFSGWGEAPSTMPAEDITIEGSFTVDCYNVIYIVDGEVYKTIAVNYGEAITLIDEPVKEGYTFSGWSEAPTIMPAKDVVISGSFAVNSYTITFIVDGEMYRSITLEYGTEIPVVVTPEKDGRKFSGWSEFPTVMPAEDVVVEGKFCYTIIYMVDSKFYSSSEIYYGNNIIAPSAPEKIGQTFVEWGNLPQIMPARDMTIHAIYSVNKYQLIFIIDGEVYETLYIEYGDKIEYPQKEGYIINWENEFLPETMPAENLIIVGTSAIDTAIEFVNEYNTETVVYTLSGHRVLNTENLEKGVYIINSKKVLVK